MKQRSDIDPTDSSEAEATAGVIAELTSLLDKESREKLLRTFLAGTDPFPEQVLTLASSRAVREDIGLQLVLKRFIRVQRYQSSNEREMKRFEPKWAVASDAALAVLFSIPPIP